MILYIHGFGSTGPSFKSKLLEEHFPNETVIYPNLKHKPEEDFETLSNIIEKYRGEKVLLVGTSLGGFYAYHLSRKFNVPCALINPSLEPYNTLVTHVGTFKNYNTNKTFEWTEEHIYELKKLKHFNERKTNYFPHLYNVFIGGKDETLNHEGLNETLPYVEIKEYPKENHRFEKFEILFEEFENILNK